MHVFTVFGDPAPKGAMRAFAVRKGGALTGKTVVTARGSARQTEWTARVLEAVQRKAGGGAEVLDGPLRLNVAFWLRRPKSAPKRRRTWADRTPDLDKLVRLILDALTGTLIADDARVVQIFAVKDYAEYSSDPRPRAFVSIDQITAGSQEFVPAELRQGKGVTEDAGAPGSVGTVNVADGRAGDLADSGGDG